MEAAQRGRFQALAVAAIASAAGDAIGTHLGVKSTVIDTAAILGVGVLVGLLVFLWKQVGAGSGRTFRNRIAAHIGISRSLFRSLLVHGVNGSPRDLLVSLEKSKLDLEQASVKLGPSLSRGIERLEARFGPQEMIDEVKPIVARLVAEAGQKP